MNTERLYRDALAALERFQAARDAGAPATVTRPLGAAAYLAYEAYRGARDSQQGREAA